MRITHTPPISSAARVSGARDGRGVFLFQSAVVADREQRIQFPEAAMHGVELAPQLSERVLQLGILRLALGELCFEGIAARADAILQIVLCHCFTM
jgi:hypothetical protein